MSKPIPESLADEIEAACHKFAARVEDYVDDPDASRIYDLLGTLADAARTASVS